MAVKKSKAISFQDSITIYFGGIQALANSKLPFTCKCGGRTWISRPDKNGVRHALPIMNFTDCFAHVRSVHREVIKYL